MQKKDYFLFFVLGMVSLIFFFHPYKASLNIDDFVTKIFYSLNRDSSGSKDIVVVEINDSSIKNVKDQWPFRRALYAKALAVLKEAGARVVSFDLVFTGKGFSEEDDQAFLMAIDDFGGKVVLAYFLDDQGQAIYPNESFKNSASTGFINVKADKDRVIRKARGFYRNDKLVDYSLAIKTISAFHGTNPTISDGHVAIGNTKIPVNTQGVININFLYKPQDIKTVPFDELLQRKFNRDIFKNKLVLISPTMKIVHDIHNTPLGYMPGSFVQANIIINILNGKFLHSISPWIDFTILATILFLISYLIVHFSFIRRILLSAGVLLVLFWISIGLKYLGWQIAYGKIALASLIFLIAGNFYSYASFLLRLLKIQNKIIVDPLTNFYNLRYFCEHLRLEFKSIGRKKGYLIVIKLDNFSFLLKGEGLERAKDIYKELSTYLFSISNLWAAYNEEVIVGELKNLNVAEKIKEQLGNIARAKNLKIDIKLALFKITPNLIGKRLISLMVNRINSSTQSILYLKDDTFHMSFKDKGGSDDFLSVLYGGAEERSNELLETIGRLKKEEKKTKQAYLELMSSLINALESKDSYTQGHTATVCKYALMLADELNLSEEEKEKIKKGALLHDLGKIGIPDAILHKKGPFTKEEFAIMKQHQQISAKILQPISEFEDIIPYVIQHHESYDGNGYPEGLSAEEISLGARIIAVADIFDALTTKRDYKKAFSKKVAVAELKKLKGIKLDPVLVDKFLGVLKKTGTIK